MGELKAYTLKLCEKLLKEFEEGAVAVPNVNGPEAIPMADSIFDCGNFIVDLLLRQAKLIYQQRGDWALLQRRLDDLISLAYEKFYVYPFKDIPKCWRLLYTDASILKACSLIIKVTSKMDKEQDAESISWGLGRETFDDAVGELDRAVIMAGAAGTGRREMIENIISYLEPFCALTHECAGTRSWKRRKEDKVLEVDAFPKPTSFIPPVSYPVNRALAPSLQDFILYMHHPTDPKIGPVPLVMENTIEHWPARNERPWNKPSYLLSRTLNGCRLVPVEIGRSYVDEGWGQKITSFADFMKDYILQPPTDDGLAKIEQAPNGDQKCKIRKGSRTGYLAQYDIFTHIPSFRADISIPDYCYASPTPPHPSSPLAQKHSTLPELEEPLLNVWFGPAGTISPMHVDPYHNILAQVVGRKYVRLYAPGESGKLYARGIEDGGVNMNNTSGLDVGVLEGWDGTEEERQMAKLKFPLYEDAEFVDMILEEGECLYIPVGWWHYVRSLSISFSVSFWWN